MLQRHPLAWIYILLAVHHPWCMYFSFLCLHTAAIMQPASALWTICFHWGTLCKHTLPDRNLPYRRQSKHRPKASSSGHTEETEERGEETDWREEMWKISLDSECCSAHVQYFITGSLPVLYHCCYPISCTPVAFVISYSVGKFGDHWDNSSLVLFFWREIYTFTVLSQENKLQTQSWELGKALINKILS